MTERQRLIEHVVVLMLENRSFDHMLGFLDHGGLEPVTGPANPTDPSHPASPSYKPFKLGPGDRLAHDPKHAYEDVMRQLTATNGPWAPPTITNTGFAWNYAARTGGKPREVMGCHTPEALPVLSALAREYTVCASWFGSVPSETWPNRLFAHAATSDGEVANVVRPYKDRTIFEALATANHDWDIYAGDVPQVAAYPALWQDDGGIRHHRLAEFFDTARTGHLAAYSFIEPRHFLAANSQHPRSQVALGERLLRDVYAAIAYKPEGWRSTMLVVTYDEHGGFFDRAAPPGAVPPHLNRHDGSGQFAFDMLGPRVPAIVVSPYVGQGHVDKTTVFDHTSIHATLQDIFDFTEVLTARGAAANKFTHLITEDQPREPILLPEPLPYREAELDPTEWADGLNDDGTLRLNELQESLVDLALLVDAQAEERPGAFGPRIAPSFGPPFRTEAEVGEFVEAFRVRLGF